MKRTVLDDVDAQVSAEYLYTLAIDQFLFGNYDVATALAALSTAKSALSREEEA